MSTSLQTKAANIEANDHAVIPCQRNGNPQPYGNEQRYPSSMVRKDDTLFGVRLDGMILLDLDGNKVAEAPSPKVLLAMLGCRARHPRISTGCSPTPNRTARITGCSVYLMG
ncbi:hypothetical protein ACSZOH_10085 [Aeromonas caviae]